MGDPSFHGKDLYFRFIGERKTNGGAIINTEMPVTSNRYEVIYSEILQLSYLTDIHLTIDYMRY
jgi:hypothetical protein